MAKKIVILNGSPRKNGNTKALVEAFQQGAESAGHQVTSFDLQQMKIHPCIGCLRGGQDKQSPCSQKDDMDILYPAYRDADVLVFASPLYYWSFSGQLKIVLDRLFAVTEAGQTPQVDCLMLIAAEDSSAGNFAPIRAYYETLVNNMGWQDKGQLFVGGVMEVGDIQGKPELEQARKLGASL